ncbi:MAG: hypothetical protein JWO69_1790 [Thermoleophilia bacterium]|nr:hypothetical protein [Thermoleophilia bacterium]
MTAGTADTTSTGVGICSLGFGSSNATATLRLGTADGAAPAMASRTAAWSVGSPQTEAAYASMDAWSSTLAMAASDFGTVARTTDGGTWTTEPVLSTPAHDIEHSSTSNDVWIVGGADQALMSTSNGFSSAPANPTWTSRKAALAASSWPADVDVLGVAAPTDLTWFVSGERGWVAATINGGTSFVSYRLPGSHYLSDIDALDDDTVYAIGDAGVLFKTDTGGASAAAWTSSTHPYGGSFTSLSIADSTHVYMSTLSGTVARYDGSAFIGSSPIISSSDHTHAIASSSAAPNTVYAVGTRGGVSRSTDGGESWTRYQYGDGSELQDAAVVDGVTAMVVGANSTIASTTDGIAWTTHSSDLDNAGMEGIAVHPVDGRIAIAVGAGGVIRRTQDSGDAWSNPTSPTSSQLNDVEFASASRLWAVGGGGTIITSANGGATWTSQVSGVSTRLLGVFAADSHRAWAVGDGGVVLHTSDAGSSWSPQASGTSHDLADGFATSSTHAWIVGGTVAQIRRTTTGGATWTPSTTPNTWGRPVAVAAADNLNLYAATMLSGVWKSIDGGLSWTNIDGGSGSGYMLNDIAVVGRVVMSSAEGGVRTSLDAGTTWRDDGGGNGRWASSGIAAADRNTVYTVSTTGAMDQLDESSVFAHQVADYGAAGASFTTGETSGAFGVCLQQVTGTATPLAGWLDDDDTCEPVDSDQWRGVPAAPIDIAHGTSGGSGGVELVWGFHSRSDQPVGDYSAGVVFEVVAA